MRLHQAVLLRCNLFAHYHNLDSAGSATGLIPVNEMDAAEFAQVHLAVFHNDGDITADDGAAQVGIGVVAAEVVLAVLFCKHQSLGTGCRYWPS